MQRLFSTHVHNSQVWLSRGNLRERDREEAVMLVRNNKNYYSWCFDFFSSCCSFKLPNIVGNYVQTCHWANTCRFLLFTRLLGKTAVLLASPSSCAWKIHDSPDKIFILSYDPSRISFFGSSYWTLFWFIGRAPSHSSLSECIAPYSTSSSFFFNSIHMWFYFGGKSLQRELLTSIPVFRDMMRQFWLYNSYLCLPTRYCRVEERRKSGRRTKTKPNKTNYLTSVCLVLNTSRQH